MPLLSKLANGTNTKGYPVCFICFNHTAFKLYSLWHVGYPLDDFYGLHMCSRVHLLLYNPARRPASTEPPRLSG
jgi:hypothetical protein